MRGYGAVLGRGRRKVELSKERPENEKGGGCMEILGMAVEVMGFLGLGLGVAWSLGVEGGWSRKGRGERSVGWLACRGGSRFGVERER